ncbi:hypothetical protein RRG08_008170 [Elysia crispata]|uniref:Uncharacterized protein n=1 Tax=Elysia crispata TaxID=231223 RepID=A0AAE0Z554_9GAST|nr:hypothetical protein RRG08_008170 [Elysia crispata]
MCCTPRCALTTPEIAAVTTRRAVQQLYPNHVLHAAVCANYTQNSSSYYPPCCATAVPQPCAARRGVH